ncbi:MAG TPA: hypothetical protein PLV98_08795, partial [Dysgonamonadaceae bacterium]|nr:hypothetical protein [Dysgonamonadaceae bacterium]
IKMRFVCYLNRRRCPEENRRFWGHLFSYAVMTCRARRRFTSIRIGFPVFWAIVFACNPTNGILQMMHSDNGSVRVGGQNQ